MNSTLNFLKGCSRRTIVTTISIYCNRMYRIYYCCSNRTTWKLILNLMPSFVVLNRSKSQSYEKPLRIWAFAQLTFSQIMALMPTLCSHTLALFFLIWILRCYWIWSGMSVPKMDNCSRLGTLLILQNLNGTAKKIVGNIGILLSWRDREKLYCKRAFRLDDRFPIIKFAHLIKNKYYPQRVVSSNSNTFTMWLPHTQLRLTDPRRTIIGEICVILVIFYTEKFLRFLSWCRIVSK